MHLSRRDHVAFSFFLISSPISSARYDALHAQSTDRVSTTSGRPHMTLECWDGNFAVADVTLVITVGEPCCDFSQIIRRNWLTAQRTERLRNGCPAIHHYEFH